MPVVDTQNSKPIITKEARTLCSRSNPTYLALLLLATAVQLAAQSLNFRTPAAVVPGENHGTVDSQVGSHYWSLRYQQGGVNIGVSFTSMGLYGSPMPATIEFVLHSPDGKVLGTRSLTSNGRTARMDWPWKFTGPGTAILELRTSSTALLRTGGDAGTYSVMVCAPDFDCQSSLAARFMADGTVMTTDGHRGTWKIFDPDSLIYSVVIGRDRWSLKLVPGRGLFNPRDLSVVVFQAVRMK
jgi:hypothetical protein